MDNTSYSLVDFSSEIISNHQNSQEIFVSPHLIHKNNSGAMFACKKPVFVNYVKCERSCDKGEFFGRANVQYFLFYF